MIGLAATKRRPPAGPRVLEIRGRAEAIAAGPMMDARDLTYDEHLAHRKSYEALDCWAKIGVRPLIGRPYKLSNALMHVEALTPDFGEGNSYVLRELIKLDEKTIEALYEQRIIVDDPLNPPAPSAGIGRAGTMGNVDEHYRENIRAFY